MESAKGRVTGVRVREAEKLLSKAVVYGGEEDDEEEELVTERAWAEMGALPSRKQRQRQRGGGGDGADTPPAAGSRKRGRTAQQPQHPQQTHPAVAVHVPKKSPRARLLFVEEDATVQAGASGTAAQPAPVAERRKEQRSSSRTRRMSERGRRAAAARWNK